jgi:hypothetical protein
LLWFRTCTIKYQTILAEAMGDTGRRVEEEFRDPVPVIVTEAFGATTLGTHGNEISSAIVAICTAKSAIRNVVLDEKEVHKGEEGSGRNG